MDAFRTITEIKAANKSIGHHFFSRGAMRFFNSKIESPVLRGRYFITSEIGPNEVKAYSVHMASDAGEIETIGGFHSFKSTKEAMAFVRELPAYFYKAYTLAKDGFNGYPVQGMSFVEQALIEPTNNKQKEFDKNTFTGACAWICENADKIDEWFLKGLAKEYKQQLNK